MAMKYLPDDGVPTRLRAGIPPEAGTGAPFSRPSFNTHARDGSAARVDVTLRSTLNRLERNVSTQSVGQEIGASRSAG
jgi:hypothetical protein